MIVSKVERSIFSKFFKEDPTIGNVNGKEKTSPVVSPRPSELPLLLKSEPAPEEELKAYWRNLRIFFRTGKGGGISSAPGENSLSPALLSSYLKSGYKQISFPFWMGDKQTVQSEKGVEDRFSSLSQLLQKAIQAFAPKEEQAKILKDNLLRIEVKVGEKLQDQVDPIPFFPALQEALTGIEGQLAISGDEGKIFSEDLSRLLDHLPKSGVLIQYSTQTQFQILAFALKTHLEDQRISLKKKISSLKARLKNILIVEREKGPAAKEPGKLEASYDFADSFINFKEFSEVLPESGSQIIPEDRLKRIENVYAILDDPASSFFTRDAVMVIIKNPENKDQTNWNDIFPDCLIKLVKEGRACSESSRAFDEQMKDFAQMIGAVRIAELEIKNSYDPKLHGEYFAHFDWRSFTKDEMRSCPQVILIGNDQILMGVEFNQFFSLITSNKPIKTLALKQDPGFAFSTDESESPQEFIPQQELASLVIAQRNTFVLQSTPIFPDHLFESFTRGISCFSPGLFHILSPGNEVDDPFLLVSAALESRGFCSIGYDIQKGPMWGSRFEIQNNPQPDADWPSYDIKVREVDKTQSIFTWPFTYADFASMDARYSDQFLVVPPQYWVDDLVLLADYLDLPLEEVYSKVPFIWMADRENNLQKVAVSWNMMLACQERLEFWHYIQENCGVHSFHVEKAIEKTRKKFDEDYSTQIASLKEEHQKAIEEVKEKAAGEAMERLSAILLDIDTISTTSETPTTIAKEIDTPETGTEELVSVTPLALEEEEEEEEEDEEISLGEPWIDSVLCTSCNECTDLNNRMFQYNNEKLAFIADPKAGTFAQLVQAAENCPPKIIHPGAPIDPNEEGLDDLIKRAEPFN